MTKKTVLVPGPMMPHVEEQLDAQFAVLRPYQSDADRAAEQANPGAIEAIATGAFHGPMTGETMARYPNLKVVASFGVGYDKVDAAWAGEHGVIVTNTPDVLTEEVADTALGLMLMTVRQFGAAERHLRAGKWEREGDFPLTQTLQDRTLGILGLGRIGKAIARRAEAIGMPIAYHGRSKQEDVHYAYHETLVGLAKAVDVLMVVVPGGAATQHMINDEVLNALGPNGILINVGRGSTVDERALIAALKEGRVLSAGLDVFEKEPHVPQDLIEMDHVTLLPHVGSASVHTRKAMGQLVVDNLKAWDAGQPPLTPVPETPFKGW